MHTAVFLVTFIAIMVTLLAGLWLDSSVSRSAKVYVSIVNLYATAVGVILILGL